MGVKVCNSTEKHEGHRLFPPVLLPLWEAMLPQHQLMPQSPQLTMLPQHTRLRSTLMRFPPTHTPTLSLMTTQSPTSRLRRPPMVPEMLRDHTPLLFPMAESNMLPTPPMVMMDMLLMSPMTEPPSTPNMSQLPQSTRLPQSTKLPQLSQPTKVRFRAFDTKS